MENHNKNNGMQCDCCGWGHHGEYHTKLVVLRWLLGLMILFVTFAVGVKLGEFKEELKNALFGPQYGMMNGSYGDDYYRRPMMGGGLRYQIAPPAAPVAPTIAPKK